MTFLIPGGWPRHTALRSEFATTPSLRAAVAARFFETPPAVLMSR